MKNHVTYPGFIKKVLTLLMAIAVLSCLPAKSEGNESNTPTAPEEPQSIMLALLLDTSNSMDGLIDQAKSQLWKIVNELAAAKCQDGKRPRIKIALYEYGNSGLSDHRGYIRQVSPLTNDLDLISEKLFALSTNGGDEYCGQVIQTSLRELEWTSSKSDLRMIFIAGNEPFTQGEVPYRVACALANEKDVVVNTIFCGNFNEGIETQWKHGADLTGGTFMSIEQNSKTVYVPTPYDKQIDALNEKLNNTYVHYGRQGQQKKEMQSEQDNNAASYGESNKVERAISKSSHAYTNSSWDMVDAYKENKKVVEETKEEELPTEMKRMNAEQRKAYVLQKSTEREQVQKEIQTLSVKRQEFIKQNQPKATTNMLDEAMINAVKSRAKAKNLSF